MRIRIANKIMQAVFDYKNLERIDLPYTGSQIRKAATLTLPPSFRKPYQSMHKVTKEQGMREFNEMFNRMVKYYSHEDAPV